MNYKNSINEKFIHVKFMCFAEFMRGIINGDYGIPFKTKINYS